MFFLGGSLAPFGQNINFLAAPFDRVCEQLQDWRRRQIGQTIEIQPASLGTASQLPLESPGTRELLLDCGPWTAYVNNDLDGGDPTGAVSVMSDMLEVRLIVALHAPQRPPGHASTQLWVLGPDGEPPLMYVRTVAAHAEDGRWSWHESGRLQPFERPDRYRARRIRDRLDRPLLVEYLAALGIDVDRRDFFGPGALFRQIVTYDVLTVPAEEARRAFAEGT